MHIQYQFYITHASGRRVGPYLLISDLPFDLIPDVLTVVTYSSLGEETTADIVLMGELPSGIILSDRALGRINSTSTPSTLEGFQARKDLATDAPAAVREAYKTLRSYYSKYRS